eukprot:m.210541 g.210541  ORF g.210541 m.210541 type:complete len:93 (+) comp15483_c1_seq4:3477-3755(+)
MRTAESTLDRWRTRTILASKQSDGFHEGGTEESGSAPGFPYQLSTLLPVAVIPQPRARHASPNAPLKFVGWVQGSIDLSYVFTLRNCALVSA